MRTALRRTSAVLAILFGAVVLVLEVRVFVHLGMPSGMKAVAYAWLLPLLIPLPISLGVNLLRKFVSWRLFAAVWLIGWGLVYLTGAISILPAYRIEVLDLALFLLPGVVSVAVGVLLIALRRRGP